MKRIGTATGKFQDERLYRTSLLERKTLEHLINCKGLKDREKQVKVLIEKGIEVKVE